MTQDSLEDVKGEKARLEDDLRRRVVLCDVIFFFLFLCGKRFVGLFKRLLCRLQCSYDKNEDEIRSAAARAVSY